MRKVVVALLLFSLPSRFAFWLVRMIWGGKYYSFGRKCRIGFSLVLVSEIRMEEESVIQSGNIIVAESVTMGEKVRIIGLPLHGTTFVCLSCVWARMRLSESPI